ncbi:MAG: hypothetical protein MUF37_01405 [Methanoregulaceae archaeon]|nr:hypothetical protein [Methanoregulaceae archaeon]
MTLTTICPLRFAGEVDFQGIKTNTQCIGDDCAWYLEGHCAVRVIAAELLSKEKRSHRGPCAD